MASSLTRARNLDRRHRRVRGKEKENLLHDHIFEGQWEELVIRFDKERGDFTVCTAGETKTAELCDSAKNRLG